MQTGLAGGVGHFGAARPVRRVVVQRMLQNRNLMVSGRRTSVRLEPQMWDALHEIARRERRAIGEIATLVDRQRHQSTLTAAIRVFIVSYFRNAATDDGHRNAGHGRLARAPRRASARAKPAKRRRAKPSAG
jgi:predicted DNA-binding ribbon-helix-helix protein